MQISSYSLVKAVACLSIAAIAVSAELAGHDGNLVQYLAGLIFAIAGFATGIQAYAIRKNGVTK